MSAQAQRREALEEAVRLKDQLAEAHGAAEAARNRSAAAEAAVEDSRQRAEQSAAVADQRAAELAAASARASTIEEELVRRYAWLTSAANADTNRGSTTHDSCAA